MAAILNSFNDHNFPSFQPILMKLVSKYMVYRALSYKIYLLLGLLTPFTLYPIKLDIYVWTFRKRHLYDFDSRH